MLVLSRLHRKHIVTLYPSPLLYPASSEREQNSHNHHSEKHGSMQGDIELDSIFLPNIINTPLESRNDYVVPFCVINIFFISSNS